MCILQKYKFICGYKNIYVYKLLSYHNQNGKENGHDKNTVYNNLRLKLWDLLYTLVNEEKYLH